MNEKVQSFLALADELLYQLRMRRQPDAALMGRVLDSATELGSEYRESENVPKELAACFIDMPTALYAAIDGLDETAAQPLFEYLDQLQDRLRDICE